MPIDENKINNINIQTTAFGPIRPGWVTTAPLPDGRTEITVGMGDTRVRRTTSDDPNTMIEHAEKNLKMAANFLAVAEVLNQRQQQEDTEKAEARKAVMEEFGFAFPTSFSRYSPAIQNVVDSLIESRKAAAAAAPPKVEFVYKPLHQLPNGVYSAYNREKYGDHPPAASISRVHVVNGHAYTFHSNLDITHKFHDGKQWALLKQ